MFVYLCTPERVAFLKPGCRREAGLPGAELIQILFTEVPGAPAS